MGSSMRPVMTWSERVVLMRSVTMEASVVDLPRAGGSGNEHQAALLFANSLDHPGEDSARR